MDIEKLLSDLKNFDANLKNFNAKDFYPKFKYKLAYEEEYQQAYIDYNGSIKYRILRRIVWR